jgi:hypothetical protein
MPSTVVSVLPGGLDDLGHLCGVVIDPSVMARRERRRCRDLNTFELQLKAEARF